MSTGVDDDIRRDFLQEAGELVQRLTEQLMALERQPQDPELLNAIFRAFHTVKGGAGFLELTPLIELCHAAEDVCNVLRNGQAKVDSMMMDVLLGALDQVQLMLDAVAREQALVAAPGELIEALRMVAQPPGPGTTPPGLGTTQTGLGTRDSGLGKKEAASGDTITEDEFEALLDQLQGKTKETPENSPLPPAGEGLGERVSVTAEAFTAPSSGAAAASRVPSPESRVPASPETQVRVDTQKLDRMMNLVGELVLVRNRLKSLRERSATDAVSRAIGELDFITRALQGAVMQLRMQPVKRVFSRFPKLARDVARQLGKQVEVELQGEDTDLDKNLVEALADPLVHMVRNSVDHGIELPELRLRAGKPAAGRLLLAAQQAGDHIVITVRDDGAGIDAERLRAKALQKGLIDAASAAQLSHDECLDLIFLPGFSTKEQISELSGRGVGMDVVRASIRALNGSVHIDSRLGQGTTFRIRVPLTLAILSALMVHASGRQYALPLSPVQDVFVLDETRIRKLDLWDVVLTRRETLRLVYLDPWLQAASCESPRHVAVAQVGDERYGFVVREVRGREEIVIKPLGASLRAGRCATGGGEGEGAQRAARTRSFTESSSGPAGVSGATVLPNGNVALILDFAGLVQAYRQTLVRGADLAIHQETEHG